MEHFGTFMGMILDFMRTPMDIWGFSISLWDVFLFVCIASIVFRFIGKLFS